MYINVKLVKNTQFELNRLTNQNSEKYEIVKFVRVTNNSNGFFIPPRFKKMNINDDCHSDKASKLVLFKSLFKICFLLTETSDGNIKNVEIKKYNCKTLDEIK